MGRTARQAGITALYHYDKFRPDYLEDLLRNRRFHCANLSNLNDPWDCRPWFRPEALEDPRIAEEFTQWILLNRPKRSMSDQQEVATRRRLLTDAEYLKGIIAEFSRHFSELIPERWGIYCLTPQPDSILMWSHYAQDHKGICLEYTTENGVFGAAREVDYLSSYPDWTPQSLTTSEMPHVLLTKSDAWKYENEFRVIGITDGVEREVKEHPLIMERGFLKIPDRALTAIIVGCQAKEKEIVDLVQANDPSVAIKRAVMARAQFRLQIESE